MINFRRSMGFWAIVLPNWIIFYASLCLVILFWYPEGLSGERVREHFTSFSVIYIFWLLTFFSFRLFEREPFRRYTTLFFSIASAMVVNLLVAIGYFYFQPELILTPRRFLLAHVALVFILILLWDLVLKALVFSRFVQPVYLFSFNPELKYLEKEIDRHSYLGFRMRGHVAESELKNLPPGSAVVFPDNLHADPAMANVIFNFRNRGIVFFNHNVFYESLLRRVYINSLDQIWFLRNITYSGKVFYGLLKRFLDVMVGLVMFILFLLSYPLVALLTKVTSPGPVFFRQQRVGKDGAVFTIYKYRTMSAGGMTNTWTQPNDRRITRVGRFLRATRLDELPQSLNLLAGNMSLVGPRPEQSGIVEELKKAIPFYGERHVVKPGITGWAQLNVYAGSLEESKLKLEYDLYYIKHQSILFDLEIVAKTAYNILTLQGK